MKKLIILLFIFSCAVLQAYEYKTVFDCSSSDADYIQSRMMLVGKTIDMIENQGDSADVALTLHGSCVAMVSKKYSMHVADKDKQNIKKAQEYLVELSKRKNVVITVCAMSLAANSIKKSEVLPFIYIAPNVFLNIIKYQNDGYALMPFK